MSLDYVDPSTPPPVQWTGSVLPEPMLYRLAPLWLFLLVLAVLGLLFYRSRLLDERVARRRAPEAIYKAIRKALDHALCTSGDGIIEPAKKVMVAIDKHLGPLLTFCAPLNVSLARLRKALDGKGEDKGNHSAAGSGCSPTLVMIGSNHTVNAGETKVAHAPAAHGLEVELSARERRIAVREALEDLSAFWSKDRVEGDLRRIQDALLITSAAETSSRASTSVVRRRDLPATPTVRAPIPPTPSPAPKPH